MRILLILAVLLIVNIAVEAVRFKGLFSKPRKCIDCQEKMVKGETDATILNEFRCTHGKNMHFECALKRMNTGDGFTECPECHEPLKSSLRHCILCSKAITSEDPDAVEMLGDKSGCEHANLYHRDCLKALSKDKTAIQCLICSKEITGASKTCAKCFGSITLDDPDAKALEFSCQHAEKFHARCVQDDTNCPACNADFNIEATCVICCEDFTKRRPNSVKLRRYKCDHGKSICVVCSKRVSKCSICNQGFK